MDFRVKKLILEEGMKNIAETEGVKLEMNFDSFTKKVTVDFHAHLQRYLGGVHKECSYSDLECEDADVFKTIEETRREVQTVLNPISAGIRDGLNTPSPAIESALVRALRSFASDKLAKHYPKGKCMPMPKIKKVIFNNPATIVLWADGDKTVVKCQPGDVFDAEKGLAMAIVKKAYGGKGNYCEILKPWIEEYTKARYKEFVEMVKQCYAEAYESVTKDVNDILEGKVDPMMIEKDEEPKLVNKHCENCKHECVGYEEEPCYTCLTAITDVSKWEPKLDKGETKGCATCKYACKDCMDEPCHACILASSSENASPIWEPKE